MEFDRSKILTVVTADQAKVGQKGWFAYDLETLERKVARDKPSELIHVYGEEQAYRFEKESNTCWSLFYPAPEQTYAERQAEWVKENGVKAGTKVRFTKGFEDSADGSDCCEHIDAKGVEGYIKRIKDAYLYVGVSYDSWAVPFTALEVIEKPTYRPFKNAEEFKPYRDEWSRVKNGGGFERVGFYDNTGVKDSIGNFITYQKLFEAGERENGEPCGVKEEV